MPASRRGGDVVVDRGDSGGHEGGDDAGEWIQSHFRDKFVRRLTPSLPRLGCRLPRCLDDDQQKLAN